MTEQLLKQPNTRKPKRAARIAKLCGAVLGVAVFLALTVNSLLCVFVDGYYPTFGGYRLFAIVSDSMEPNIPTGDMIVGRVPKSADDISVGDVITFEVRSGGATALITHRVTEVRVASDGAITYTTKGDNAPRADSVHPAYSDVVGVYTGKKVRVLWILCSDFCEFRRGRDRAYYSGVHNYNYAHNREVCKPCYGMAKSRAGCVTKKRQHTFGNQRRRLGHACRRDRHCVQRAD